MLRVNIASTAAALSLATALLGGCGGRSTPQTGIDGRYISVEDSTAELIIRGDEFRLQSPTASRIGSCLVRPAGDRRYELEVTFPGGTRPRDQRRFFLEQIPAGVRLTDSHGHVMEFRRP